MNKKHYRIILAILGMFSGLTAWTQDSTGIKKPEMADALRSNGKIYVVIAVLVTILLGLFLYIIQLDRKISNLEKSNKN